MKKTIILIFFTLLFSACEKYVDLDIEELSPTLVVDAFVSNEVASSNIKITMSKGLKNNNSYAYDYIADAQVTIKDQNGNQINCLPDTEGIYHPVQALIPNMTYTLDVVKNTHHITATTTMPELVILTDFKKVMIDGYSYLDLYFDDNPNQKDYYYIKAYMQDANSTWSRFNGFFNDINYNRQTHKLRIDNPFYHSGNSNNSYIIELYHITKETYEYFQTLDGIEDLGYGVTPFTTGAPGNPNSNMSNGIGYFAVGTMSRLQKNNLD